jgi:hypothetical protein
MNTDRKHALTVSAVLLSTTLTLAGCSREIGATGANDEASRAANHAARSAAEATGAARSAVDELVDANNALLLRVEDLEARLANAEGRRVERAPATESVHSEQPSEPTYRAAPMPVRTTRSVTADFEDYVPEPSRTEYRYDDDRYQATPVLADADWSTPSRLRDVPRPSSPPREIEQRSEPAWRRLTIEEGTPIAVEILDPVSTRYSRPGDSFNARLASDLLADDGRVAIREGAEISGHVAEVKKSQRIGGRASLLVAMDRIEPRPSAAPPSAARSWAASSTTVTATSSAVCSAPRPAARSRTRRWASRSRSGRAR